METLFGLFLLLICFGVVYALTFPLVMMGYLTRRLDPFLFNERYWQSLELAFPFYRYRRAMMYSLGTASRWAARRRFGGFEFSRYVGPVARLGCVLYAFFMVFCTVSILPFAFVSR